VPRNCLACWPGIQGYTIPAFSRRVGGPCTPALKPALDKVNRTTRTKDDPDDLRWLRDNMAMLWAAVWNTRSAFKLLRNLPHARTPNGLTIPRSAAVSEAYLHAVQFSFAEKAFSEYLSAFQKHTVLKFQETMVGHSIDGIGSPRTGRSSRPEVSGKFVAFLG
jgi:hypothetical protein